MRIGIDIGNVIIGGGGADTSFFEDNYLQTPEVFGAFDSIRDLRQAGHEIHCVSKAGRKIEARSIEWLHHYGFIGACVLERRVHFVRERQLKAPMAQALQLDIFIDDRRDIIESLEGVVKHRILFSTWEDTNAALREILGGTTRG